MESSQGECSSEKVILGAPSEKVLAPLERGLMRRTPQGRVLAFSGRGLLGSSHREGVNPFR